MFYKKHLDQKLGHFLEKNAVLFVKYSQQHAILLLRFLKEVINELVLCHSLILG